MRFAQIRSMDISDGEGIGVALYTQGCTSCCKGCHNPETWDLNSGEEYTEDHEIIILDLMSKKYINHFSILGGEPLLPRNLKELIKLCKNIKTLYPNKKIWCWTGYHWKQIFRSYLKRINEYNKPNRLFEYYGIIGYNTDDMDNLRELFQYIDILITEPFKIDQRDINLKWRGSKNQMVIDLQATLKQEKLDKPILYCE